MLQEVFYWVFNMSITAAVTGTLILLIRSIKKLPKRLVLFLWAIPFARMTVPVGLNSPYSFMSLLSKVSTKTVVVYQPTKDMAFSMMNSVVAADAYFPITYKVNILGYVFGVASVIWVIGSAVLLLLLTVLYVGTLRAVKDATNLGDGLYLSDRVKSPAVYGIIKPKILLPTSWQDRNLELIMLHEKMHIRRRDNLWRLLAVVITAMHWFNPLCWVFLKLFLTDLELSCDECVLQKLGHDRAKEYARTLLESRSDASVFASSFGGAKLRERIENILSFQKLTRFSAAIFTLWIFVIFYVLLTNAV